VEDGCAIAGCKNKRAKHRSFCDRHRKTENRPALPAPPTRAVHAEMKDEARKHAAKALKRLVTNLDVGPPSSQIAAARAVLGIAGVQLQPEANVKHVHEVPTMPAGVSVADLVALVRGLASPREPQQVVVDVTPRPQPLVGPMAQISRVAVATPAAASAPEAAQTHEITEISPYDAPASPADQGGPSGYLPEAPGEKGL
jgi:hypothetical protein